VTVVLVSQLPLQPLSLRAWYFVTHQIISDRQLGEVGWWKLADGWVVQVFAW